MAHVSSISWLVATLALVALIRWSWRRSPLLGACMLFGVLARAIGGFALFWISLRHLPILPRLQLGNGFWLLALDGVSYYDAARIAAEHGLSTIAPASASPAYVRLLAIALRVCGESPLTAVLLNVTAFALSCAIVVLMWPRRPTGGALKARAVAIGALAFSPSLLLASTQPLKDQVFALAVVAAIACLRVVSIGIAAVGAAALARGAIALAGAAAAVYAIAGIRAYYAVLVVLAAALVLAAATLLQPYRRWALHIAATAVVTAALWTAFSYGAGPYAEPYSEFVTAVLRIPLADSTVRSAAAPLDNAREGFLGAGGGTNIVRRHKADANPVAVRLTDGAIGMTALFVPISLLRGLSIVDITGGRGMLAVTDVETVFLDLTIALQLWLVLRHRKGRLDDVTFLMFVLALATAAMLPMAYVVTNYGTMFRLRLMYAIPLWLSGAALAGAEALAPAGAKEAPRRWRTPRGSSGIGRATSSQRP